MSKIFSQIKNHPDFEELMAKINIGTSSQNINAWLRSKYTLPTEKKFIISAKAIKQFTDNYLDVYNYIQQDLSNTRKAISSQTEEQLQLTLQNSPGYKNLLLKTAEEELDIRQMIKRLCLGIEHRLSQVFDDIQAKFNEDPQNINMKVDRLLIEYAQVFGEVLEKYYKFTEEPSQVGQVSIQNNINLQVGEHMSIFHDIIKDILSSMDLETSLKFMELFSERMQKLTLPDKTLTSLDVRHAEAQILNETITKKLNDIN